MTVFTTKPLSRTPNFEFFFLSLLRYCTPTSYVNQINGFVSECSLSGKKDVKEIENSCFCGR